MGQNLFFAVEKSQWCARLCFGECLTFPIQIFDNEQKEVIRLSRSWNCCLKGLKVFGPPNNFIGRVQNNLSLCLPKLSVKDDAGETICEIQDVFARLTKTGCIDFHILNRDGRKIGRIYKKWSGAARELLTTADYFGIELSPNVNLHTKILILGAVFLILSVEQQEFCTATAQPNISEWNQTFTFNPVDYHNAEIRVSIVTAKDNIILALATIKLPEDIKLNQSVDKWFELHSPAGDTFFNKAAGSIRLVMVANAEQEVQSVTGESNNILLGESCETRITEIQLCNKTNLCEKVTPLSGVIGNQHNRVYQHIPFTGSYTRPLSQNVQFLSRPTEQLTIQPLASHKFRPCIYAPHCGISSKPNQIIISSHQLIEKIQDALPQVHPEKILEALRLNNSNVDDTINYLLTHLIDDASKTVKGKKLFSTKVMEIFKIPSDAPSSTEHVLPAATPSQFQGKRRALLIGINYSNTPEQLYGCVPDVFRMRQLLTGAYGFINNSYHMQVLVDESTDTCTHHLPTRANIFKAMAWLTRDVKPGDCLVFHYSGHGSQKLTSSPEWESDMLDETILPCDWRLSGHITDDELNLYLVQKIPHGVKLTAILDCCHSGTGMDLPYVFSTSRRLWRHISAPSAPKGDVQLLSGCRSDQKSADIRQEEVGAGGVMTFALVTSLAMNPYSYKYFDLLKRIEGLLHRNGFNQKPQLSSSHPFDTTKHFSFTNIFQRSKLSPPLQLSPYRYHIAYKYLNRTIPGFLHETIE